MNFFPHALATAVVRRIDTRAAMAIIHNYMRNLALRTVL